MAWFSGATLTARLVTQDLTTSLKRRHQLLCHRRQNSVTVGYGMFIQVKPYVQNVTLLASKKQDVEDGKISDVIQSAMGKLGRWQIIICLWISLLKVPVAWYQLSIVFLAPPVDAWCAGTNRTVGADTCSRPANLSDDSAWTNETRGCDSFEYDRSVFSETIVTQWDLVCDRQQLADWAQTVFMFGVLVGNLLFGMAADRYGRKMPLLIAICLQLVSGVATAFVPWFSAFLVLRFLQALATGGTMTTSFVICMEIVGGKWRTIVAVLYHVPFSIGHSLMGLIAYFFRDWHDYQLVISIPSVILLAYWWTVPESPRWLLAVGKEKEGVAILENAAKVNQLGISDMKQHLAPVLNQKTKDATERKANILDLFRTPNMRKKTLCVYFNWLVCGVCFFGLAQYMGRTGGNIFLNVVLSGLAELPGAMFCMLFMSKIGRRNTLIMSQGVAAVACLLIMATPQGPDAPAWPRISLAAIGIVGMSVSFPTVYLFTGELFPTVVRNVGVGSSSMCARIGSMAAPFISSLGVISVYLPPLFFGLAPLIGSLLCFLLPETAGFELPESLEDGENFGKKKKKMENAILGASNFAYVHTEVQT